MMEIRTLKSFGFSFVAALVLGALLGCATAPTPSPPPASTSSPPVSAPAPDAGIKLPSSVPFCMAPYYPPPDRIDLCGEPVPLEAQDVHERFDREFTLIVYNHAQVYLWLKRMVRYFPWIEERLRHYNLPEDLKYVAIVESDLQPNACSPKGAAGPWQFMPSTGAAYGLDQQGSCDRRYDFERSTEGAFRLLRDLYARHKNWALALAAYNCGDRRIYDEMRSQHVTDYYHLRLPQETERYVMRILAVKAVLGNPGQYGYFLPKGAGYAELKLDRVRVSLPGAVPIQSVAASAGITYREFKRLNPEFRADDVPAGSHELKFPAGTGRTFEQNFKSSRAAPAATPSLSQETAEKTVDALAPAPAPMSAAVSRPAASKPAAKTAAPAVQVHTVKKGETLFSIAQHYKVSVQALREANSIKGTTVTLGQKLRIP